MNVSVGNRTNTTTPIRIRALRGRRESISSGPEELPDRTEPEESGMPDGEAIGGGEARRLRLARERSGVDGSKAEVEVDMTRWFSAFGAVAAIVHSDLSESK